MSKQIELIVEGMTCASCAAHVEQALERLPGVADAHVPGWESKRAIVTLGSEVDPSALVSAVEEAGYRARLAPQHDNQPSAEGATIMVIGGGSAGFAAAIKASELGAHVLLVNDGPIGGTCVNVGCVPSKALIRAMEQYHRAGEHPFRGVHTSKGALNWAQVVAHKDELVAELRQAKYLDVLAAYPTITYVEGRARLLGENRVAIGDTTYTPDAIILATGASPWIPPIPGLADAPVLTSTTAMAMRTLPRSLIVLGANAVGLEQAQIFARAGVPVTVVELMPRIAPFEDETISAALQEALEQEGLLFETSFETEKVVSTPGRVTLHAKDGRQVSAEYVLVATGRRPNTDGLGLEDAGVERGKRGEVIVDETLRTTNPYVYAAGDITGRDMFVYVAAYAGALAAENALTGAGKVYRTDYIPRVTFTDPQIASAGLTEAQARAQGYTVHVSELSMAHVPRALAARDTRGLVKLVADANTDRLLGAHILAPEAGDIIQIAALALKLGLTVSEIRETLFPYLTNAEAIKLAAIAFEKDVEALSCCAG
nr:mercury(II) reductase [Ardenticatena sp.]